MIEARDLTKHYGEKLAVDHLSFTVEPGRVTGFLGPNGAGKSTTMRLILGLDHPQSGTATIDGRRYADLAQPLRTVGALLEARAMHPGRSAYNHLLFLAQTQGLPRSRVDHVLDLVGLGEVARKRTGGYSLGMGQRVGIAVAMLGDPQVLMLDEPVNGLDPEGILWIRNLMKQLAAEGRTVFVSSHLMNEMAVTADHLIVIGRGKLIADCSTQEFIERSSEKYVLVRSPDAARLADLVAAEGGKATIREQPARDNHAREAPAREASAGDARAGDADGARPGRRAAPEVDVTGLDAPRIGEIAAANRIVLHELTPQLASLEEAYMELTADSSEFGTGRASASPQPAAASPGTPPGGSPASHSPGGHSPGDPARVTAAQERTE
jgi:ABC-2 type transport system ATP-binding protein